MTYVYWKDILKGSTKAYNKTKRAKNSIDRWCSQSPCIHYTLIKTTFFHNILSTYYIRYESSICLHQFCFTICQSNANSFCWTWVDWYSHRNLWDGNLTQISFNYSDSKFSLRVVEFSNCTLLTYKIKFVQQTTHCNEVLPNSTSMCNVKLCTKFTANTSVLSHRCSQSQNERGVARTSI